MHPDPIMLTDKEPMEHPEMNMSDLVERSAELVKQHVDLIRLNLTEKISELVSSISIAVILFLTASYLILFAGVGCAWWISEHDLPVSVGFFIVTLVFLVLFIGVLTIGKKYVRLAIENIVIKSMLHDKEH